MTTTIARDTLTVEGPDAAKYLQGQLSNDVVGLAIGASCWSFLLDPSGKLGFLLRVLRLGESAYVLDLEAGQAPAAEARLRRFLIRTKVTLSAGSATVDLDPTDDASRSDLLVGWWGEGRHRFLPAEPTVVGEAAGRASSPESESLRIAAGWPGPAELTEGIIPGETGVVPCAVNFQKGCYTGQELVARIDSRGNNVPHHLSKVTAVGELVVGADVVVDDTAVGSITSAAGTVGLAYVRRSIEPPVVATVGDVAARVEAQRAGAD